MLSQSNLLHTWTTIAYSAETKGWAYYEL